MFEKEQNKAFYTLYFHSFPQPAGDTWCVCAWQGLFSTRWLLMGSAVCSLTIICVSAHGVVCNMFVSRRLKDEIGVIMHVDHLVFIHPLRKANLWKVRREIQQVCGSGYRRLPGR